MSEAIKLLLKIHVITGWAIPEKEFLDILLDQFVKKCMESYARINPDEIEYAFRNKPEHIKDWGKTMSLSLMDEVILPYIAKRFDISVQYENLKLIEVKISDEEKEKINREYEECIKNDPITAKKYGLI
jgi:hypothetical protein